MRFTEGAMTRSEILDLEVDEFAIAVEEAEALAKELKG